MEKYQIYPKLPFDICQIYKPRPPFFFKKFKKDEKIGACIKILPGKEKYRLDLLLFGKISNRIPIYKKINFKENNEIFLKKNLPLYKNSKKLFFLKTPLDNLFSCNYVKKQISKNFSKHLDFKKILNWRKYNSRKKIFYILPTRILNYFLNKLLFF